MTTNEIKLKSLLDIKPMVKAVAEGNLDELEQLIADVKRLVRADRKETEKVTLVKADEDSATYKIMFDSKEDAESYFYNYCYKDYIPAHYDCTGQIFTLWHKVFAQGDGFVLYWEDGIDV